MNLEDREQLNQLFEQEKFDKVCNLAAQASVRYSLENPVCDFTYIDDIVEGVVRVIDNPPAQSPLEAGVPEGGTACPDELSRSFTTVSCTALRGSCRKICGNCSF